MANTSSFSTVKAAFSFDRKRLQYRDNATGRFVPAEDVRRAMLKVVRASKRRIGTLAASMADGTISVADWQQAMEAAVKDLHLASVGAAKGGFGTMTPRDYGLAGARLRRQYEFIDNFSRDVESGRLSTAKILWRAGLYADGSRGVYENARREVATATMTEERRVRGKRDSCPTCIEQAGLGWQAIGTLKRIGDSECQAQCGCEFAYRNDDAGD